MSLLLERIEGSKRSWKYYFLCNICNKKERTSKREYSRIALTGYAIPDGWDKRLVEIGTGLLEIQAVCPECGGKGND